jgi:ribose-phosphate pyrophosphokinase
MIDTAGTITKAEEALKAHGAATVIAAATHGVLSGPAVDRLKNSGISEVVLTNTLPLPSEARIDKITELSIAPVLAAAIKAVSEDGSVTGLFGGDA